MIVVVVIIIIVIIIIVGTGLANSMIFQPAQDPGWGPRGEPY